MLNKFYDNFYIHRDTLKLETCDYCDEVETDLWCTWNISDDKESFGSAFLCPQCINKLINKEE